MAVHSIHEDGKTVACLHRIVNKSSRRIKVVWVGFDSREICYMEVEPGHARPQQTFTTHVWRIRFADSEALVGEYSGLSASLEVQPDGVLAVRSWTEAVPEPKPEWGQYGKRGDALGIEIWSYECVDERAIRIAAHIVRRMLEVSPRDVVRRLVSGGAKVAVIGRQQVTTDIPAHTFMRWVEGGRDTDSTTRGLGGTEESPTTSCGEENLLMEDDRFYSSENILVHEFGHAVMNIGLTAEDRATIKELYQKAYRSGLYDKDAYIMENEDEYWAEGTQAWFDATIRTDVTSGVNTREKLRSRDPALARMMIRAYGDGSWRYPHDSPAPFSRKRNEPDGAVSVVSGPTAAAFDILAPAATPGPARVASGDSAKTWSLSTQSDGADQRTTTTLDAPGVEAGMERVRLAASLQGADGAWLFLLPAGCAPRRASGSGTGECGGLLVPPGGASPGCTTALWAAVREVMVGPQAHSTVKLS